jgi:hypothetical protein
MRARWQAGAPAALSPRAAAAAGAVAGWDYSHCAYPTVLGQFGGQGRGGRRRPLTDPGGAAALGAARSAVP